MFVKWLICGALIALSISAMELLSAIFGLLTYSVSWVDPWKKREEEPCPLPGSGSYTLFD